MRSRWYWLLCALVFSSCATVEIPDIGPVITLPASENGYRYTTISNKSTLIPKAEWNEMKKRGIVLLSEDWAKLKVTLLKNCLSNKCKSTIGALDGLFYAIDDALKELPGVKK